MEKYLENIRDKCIQMLELLDDIECKCLKVVSKTLNEETDLTEERAKYLKEIINIAGAVESLKNYWRVDNFNLPKNIEEVKPFPWWALWLSVIMNLATLIIYLSKLM